MKAVRCHDLGSLSELILEEVPDPVPGNGEVLVQVAAAAVNYADALMVLGRYQFKPPTPFTPGVDVAGIVTAVGPGCTQFAVHDRVHGLAPLGGFAEKVSVPEMLLRRTADNLPSDLAATTGSAYRTAYDALVSVAKLSALEDLVILGAAGAVGSAAIQIGKVLGARVIACASSADKLSHCTSLGADEIIDYSTEGLKQSIKTLCPNGASVVLDLVGGKATEEALRATSHGSRLIVVGFASGEIPRVPLNLVLLKGCSILGYEIISFEMNFPSEADANHTRLEDLIATGAIVPPIEARYRLVEAPLALERATSRDKRGITLLDLTGATSR